MNYVYIILKEESTIMYELSSKIIMDQIAPLDIGSSDVKENNILKPIKKNRNNLLFLDYFKNKLLRKKISDKDKIYKFISVDKSDPDITYIYRNHLNMVVDKHNGTLYDYEHNISLLELEESSQNSIFYMSESSFYIDGQYNEISSRLFTEKNNLYLNSHSMATTIIDGNFSIKNIFIPNKIISGIFGKSMSFNSCLGMETLILSDFVPALNTLSSSLSNIKYVSTYKNKGHYPGSFFIRNCIDLKRIDGLPVAINIRISNCPNLSGVLKLRKNCILSIDDISSKNLTIELIDTL